MTNLEDLLRDATMRRAAFHDHHGKKLLRRNGIDPERWMADPTLIAKDGYRVLHERNGEENRLVLARVVDEQIYYITTPTVDEESET